jgi:hypothetical protein
MRSQPPLLEPVAEKRDDHTRRPLRRGESPAKPCEISSFFAFFIAFTVLAISSILCCAKR